jgi:hypothetical protein
MTSVWGPMGWMTLHSISVAYPEIPTLSDKLIVNRFIDKFAECITCHHCKSHFTTMFMQYKRIHPDWADSRFNVFLFVCRAHNTVNRRLDKPIKKSVAECLETLVAATSQTSSATFRRNYIAHVMKNWVSFQSGDGMIMVGVAKELDKINNEYWIPRDVDFKNVSFPEADVLEFIPDDIRRIQASPDFPALQQGFPLPKVGFSFKGGRLSLVSR